MPRYHFGLADGAREADPQGADLVGPHEARLMATRYAGELLQNDPGALLQHGQWRVEVTDDHGALLFTVIMLAIEAPASHPPGVDPA